MDVPFRDYASYLKEYFGERIQKVSINTGYSCPNRDGSKGRGGCTYCNLNTLEPAYRHGPTTITEQLEKGIAFYTGRTKAKRFLAYFQSYTNTYADTTRLIRDYEEAVGHPQVAGLVIGTRPDCIVDDVADYLQHLASRCYVSVEFGIESTDDATLQRVNRCHTYEETVKSIRNLASRGIPTGGHLILGFPWESREVMLDHATKLSGLPLTFIKLHHLQILRGTALARESLRSHFELLSMEDYLELVISFIERSRPGVVFQRFLAEAPEKWLIAPRWNGIRNCQFTDVIRREMSRRQTTQGACYQRLT